MRPLRRSPYRICGKQKATGQDRAARSHANPLESRSVVHKLKHQTPLAGLPEVARNLEQSFLQALEKTWSEYAARAQGINVVRVDGKTVLLEAMKFVGITPRMPRIQVDDPFEREPKPKTRS